MLSPPLAFILSQDQTLRCIEIIYEKAVPFYRLYSYAVLARFTQKKLLSLGFNELFCADTVYQLSGCKSTNLFLLTTLLSKNFTLRALFKKAIGQNTKSFHTYPHFFLATLSLLKTR